MSVVATTSAVVFFRAVGKASVHPVKVFTRVSR